MAKARLPCPALFLSSWALDFVSKQKISRVSTPVIGTLSNAQAVQTQNVVLMEALNTCSTFKSPTQLKTSQPGEGRNRKTSDV